MSLEAILSNFAALPSAVQDLAIVGLEVLALSVLFLLFGAASGFVLERIARGRPEGAREAVRKLAAVLRLLLFTLFGLLFIATLAINSYLYFGGGGIFQSSLRFVSQLPADFPTRIAIGVASLAGGLIITILFLQVVRLLLARLRKRALDWERLSQNDRTINDLFRLLTTTITITVWLVASATFATWVGAPSVVGQGLFLAVRVYLIASLAFLTVKGVAALVDSFDGLAARFSGPKSPLRFYEHFRSLVPLLRRCLELVVWLLAATLILLQIDSFANFAGYGPRLVQVVAIFFLARVAAEATNFLVDRTQAGGPELTELEQQQRATLLPLIKSIGRAIVYFVAVILILNTLGLNPVPLLAGAGILGVVIGFGAQAVINDLVSGFFILSESQFLVGDYIEAGTARGVVESIQIRTTRLRDPNGQLHIVRNGQLTGVVNYSKTYTFAVVEVELPFGADLQLARRAIQSAARTLSEENRNVLVPTSIDGLERFGPSGLIMRTTTKVRPGTHGVVAREFRELVLVALRDAGLAPTIDSVSLANS